MSNTAKTVGLSLVGLMASATMALAQPPADQAANTTAEAPAKNSLFPGLKLERWDDKPEAKPAKPAKAPAEAKKNGLLATLGFEPRTQKAEAVAAKPVRDAPGVKAPEDTKKNGLLATLGFEPRTQKTETVAAGPVVDEEKSNIVFSGFKLEPWDDKDEAKSGQPKAALKEPSKDAKKGGFFPWAEAGTLALMGFSAP